MLSFAADNISKAKFVIAAMKRARERGISVPKIHPDRLGRYLIKIGERYYFLQDYIAEGKDLSYEEAGEEEFFAIGKMAAKVNNVFSEVSYVL